MRRRACMPPPLICAAIACTRASQRAVRLAQHDARLRVLHLDHAGRDDGARGIHHAADRALRPDRAPQRVARIDLAAAGGLQCGRRCRGSTTRECRSSRTRPACRASAADRSRRRPRAAPAPSPSPTPHPAARAPRDRRWPARARAAGRRWRAPSARCAGSPRDAAPRAITETRPRRAPGAPPDGRRSRRRRKHKRAFHALPIRRDEMLLDDDLPHHPVPVVIGTDETERAWLDRHQEYIDRLARLHHDLLAIIRHNVPDRARPRRQEIPAR